MTEETKIKKEKVAFSPEQMEIIQSMLKSVKEDSISSSPNRISMYEVRDPTKIETVFVKRYDGMFVMGFKNFQNDPMKKNPRYLVYKKDETRGLFKEPFITLILSDGKETIEKEVMLIDYMDAREKYQAKVVKIDLEEVVDDYGILGASGEFAVAVNAQGVPESRPTIKSEVKRQERIFWVELEGFDKPQKFITDFLT